MALNNSQYDEIFRSYDAKQLKAQHQLEERTKAAYERSPELKALDASIAEISVASARRLLDGDSSALTALAGVNLSLLVEINTSPSTFLK